MFGFIKQVFIALLTLIGPSARVHGIEDKMVSTWVQNMLYTKI